YAMAISGVMLLGFVVSHMIGNLHVFQGAAEINEYGEGLRDLGEPLFPRTFVLWVFFRAPLAAAFAVHIHAAYTLGYTNLKARGTSYQSPRDYLAANYASRTMRWSGTIVLLFLAWHLADLTWGIAAVNPEFVRGEIYDNLVFTFSRWPVVVLYLVAQIALAFHIRHGAWSLFQSVGANNPRFNKFRRTFANTFTAIVVIGFLAVPFGTVFGIIQ
ncbi:MAG TPA: succinate dehydrogenase cytochrome b subunit, partial [Actinobacteria bacterium]|nr:succinate dehydrogenase cytochrome b subunit [Actinomycetota bacterium]